MNSCVRQSGVTTDSTAHASSPEDASERLAAEGLAACYIWNRVLATQADRLASTGFVPEGYVFILALRNLRRAAALVASALTQTKDRQAANAALVEFDLSLPGAKQARDILEHFDDYARGVGNLQRRQPEPVSFPVTVDVGPAAGGGRQMVLNVGEFAVPIADAAATACRLHADIYAAAHPDPAFTTDWCRRTLCEGIAHGVIADLPLHPVDQ